MACSSDANADADDDDDELVRTINHCGNFGHVYILFAPMRRARGWVRCVTAVLPFEMGRC